MQEFVAGALPHQSENSAATGAAAAGDIAQSGSVLRQIGRDLCTVQGKLVLGASGVLMLSLAPSAVGLGGQSVVLGGKEFLPKEEAFIMIIGPKAGRELEKMVRDPVKRVEIETLLRELNGCDGIPVTVDKVSPIIHIMKEVTNHHTGGREYLEHRESLIRFVECAAISDIVTRVGACLGKELVAPYLYITLYTHGSRRCIAVPDCRALEAAQIGEIPAAQFEELKAQSPRSRRTTADQIRDFVAIAKEILASGAPDLSAATPAQAAQLRAQLLTALSSPDPIDALTGAIQNRDLAAVLHKLLALHRIPQDPRHHPEGNVLVHTLMVLAEAAALCDQRALSVEDRNGVMLGVLLHDLGKGEPDITQIKPNGSGGQRIIAYGHEGAGVKPAHEILRALGLLELAPVVLDIVKHHMLLPERYRRVQEGQMRFEECVERMRRFLARDYLGPNPEVFLICTIADCRGRGMEATKQQRESFIEGMTQVFRAATSSSGPHQKNPFA